MNFQFGGELDSHIERKIKVYPYVSLFIRILVIVVQSLSCIQLFATHGLQFTKLPCLSLSPRVHSNS